MEKIEKKDKSKGTDIMLYISQNKHDSAALIAR